MDTTASRLALARQQAGLTQGQVARIIGLHRPSISEMEAGRRRVTSDELRKLAEIYGVSVSWLVGAEADTNELESKVELAARELAKLKKEDLDRILRLVAALRQAEGNH